MSDGGRVREESEVVQGGGGRVKERYSIYIEGLGRENTNLYTILKNVCKQN